MLRNSESIAVMPSCRINLRSGISSVFTHIVLFTVVILLVSSSVQPQSAQQFYRSHIIVDSTKPNAYFGLYRMTQMTDPGWDLFRQTVDWAMNYQDHSNVQICIAPYDDLADLQSSGRWVCCL